MDFMNRGVRQPQQTASTQPEDNISSQPHSQGVGSHKEKSGKFKKIRSGNFTNFAYVALLFSVTIVIVGVVLAISLFDQNNEEQFVDKGKFQAVFLNNGQVYFGKIGELNKDYLNVSDIYYLRVNQQVQPGQQASQNDVSLVKLGCELHGPQDSMVVNRDQVTFWENLKDDGQVAKAVAEYVKANPNGQNCAQQQQQQPQNNNSSSTNSSDENKSTNTNGSTTKPSTGSNSSNNTNNP